MSSGVFEGAMSGETGEVIPGRHVEPQVARGIGCGKLILGGAAFLLLTAGIFWYQVHRIQIGDQIPQWRQLRWSYLFLILLVLPVETVASGLRTWLLIRVLQPRVGLWTCLKAEWANSAIAILTPSQTGGGPGQIYMLSREGVGVGTALAATLLSFVGTMVGLFSMGLYSLLVSNIAELGPLFMAAVWTLIAICLAMVLAAIRPGLFRAGLSALSRIAGRILGRAPSLHGRWPAGHPLTAAAVDRLDRLTASLIDIIYAYRDNVWRLLRAGKTTMAWVCLLSLVFLFSRTLMPYLCIRFLGLEGSTLRQVIEVQMALIFLLFFAPTPGGAGLAEGASLSIMDGIVPIGFAPYYTLLWRFSTAYLAATAGMVCLVRALVQDAQRLIERGRS